MASFRNAQFSKAIQDISGKVSLVELIGGEIRLQKKGGTFWGLCPFHPEKTPSFTVNEAKNFYHCFGCGEHGDAISYVMKTKSQPFLEALKFLADRAGVTLPQAKILTPQEKALEDEREKKRTDSYGLHKEAADYCHQILKNSPKAEKAREYLKNRGVSWAIAQQFQLGYCDGSLTKHLIPLVSEPSLLEQIGLSVKGEQELHDRFGGRLLFPIRDPRHRVIAFGGRLISENSGNRAKYLNSSETDIFHKGSNLYNLDQALASSKKEPLILVEGYMDVIAMVQYDFSQTVASLGTALTEEQIERVWRTCDQPVLCFDGDAAGQKAALRAVNRALPLLKPGKTLFFCYLPKNLDPDNVLRQQGRAAMQERLSKALPLIDVLWNHWAQPLLDPQRTDWLPEEMAALKKEISDTIQVIPHEEIRFSYRQILLDRFYALKRQKRGLPFFQHEKKLFFNKNELSRPQNILGQKILLGILLKNPILLIEVEELFLRIDFTDLTLIKVKEWLLGEWFSDQDFSTEKRTQQCTALLEKMGESLLKTHASFVFDPEISKEDLVRRWKEIWFYTINLQLLKGDRARIKEEVKENLDTRSWEQMKALFLDVVQQPEKEQNP
ncbi:hypothetical protein AGMMS49949_02980 [Alphaproteobacteria bacterium]|nr:hypothetical protein AGMMS49949_02980 [Alphaproteobacteria bacterium]GHS96275.1 hypothetical protein AGMMS50296_2280 [Alphaproteobacteria bacterium]